MTTRKSSLKRELSFTQRRYCGRSSFFSSSSSSNGSSSSSKKPKQEGGRGGGVSSLAQHLLQRQGSFVQEIKQCPKSRPHRVSFGDLETVLFNREDSSRSLTGGVTVSKIDNEKQRQWPVVGGRSHGSYYQQQNFRWDEQSVTQQPAQPYQQSSHQSHANFTWRSSGNNCGPAGPSSRSPPCRWDNNSFDSSSSMGAADTVGTAVPSAPMENLSKLALFHPGRMPQPSTPATRQRSSSHHNVYGAPRKPIRTPTSSALPPPPPFLPTPSSSSSQPPQQSFQNNNATVMIAAAPPKLPSRSSSPTTLE